MLAAFLLRLMPRKGQQSSVMLRASLALSIPLCKNFIEAERADAASTAFWLSVVERSLDVAPTLTCLVEKHVPAKKKGTGEVAMG